MKKFTEFNKINEKLSNASIDDLEELKDCLTFASEYLSRDENLEIHELVSVVDKIKSMSWNELEEWTDSILTNHRQSELDKFTVSVIFRYCSDIEEEL